MLYLQFPSQKENTCPVQLHYVLLREKKQYREKQGSCYYPSVSGTVSSGRVSDGYIATTAVPPGSTTTQRCECGFSTLGWIVCDQETKIVTVNREFCVTGSGQDGLYYIGGRPLNYKFNNTNRMFSELPTT